MTTHFVSHNTQPPLQSLDIRVTHKYVGTCSDLDIWESIGQFVIDGTITDLDHESLEAQMTQTHRVRVFPASEGTSVQRIRGALRDAFTKSGCHHDHDCCGCRSFHVVALTQLHGNVWIVETSSSSNY